MSSLQETKTTNGYVYRVTDCKTGEYWILSKTTDEPFEPKITSRGSNIKKWVKEHVKDYVEIQLERYYTSSAERYKIMTAAIQKNKDLCLNYKLKKKGHRVTERSRAASVENMKRLQERKRQEHAAILARLEASGAFMIGFGTRRTFYSAEELTEWVKEQHFKFLNNVVWDSDKIKDKISRIFNTHFMTSHEFTQALRFKYCTQNKIEFWEERGYPHDEALKRVFSFQQKGACASKVACELFAPYYFSLKEKGYKCYIHQKVDSESHEYFLRGPDSFYQYDFTILNKNSNGGLIFEYNGSHVHARPSWSASRLSAWRHCFSGKTAEETIAAYQKKILTAEEHGFTIIVLWDEDYDNQKKIERTLSSVLSIPY